MIGQRKGPRMRHVIAGLGLGAVFLAVGCDPLMSRLNRNKEENVNVRIPTEVPTAENLVSYVNENASRLQGMALRSDKVLIDCKQGGQNAPGLTGTLICQADRNFRLTGRAVGSPAVDIGSNSDEFWYWISKAEPPYVYHCSYKDLAGGNVRMPFPFQPDLIVAALGLAPYDPAKKYDLKVNERTLELSDVVKSPQGRDLRRVTVFNRGFMATERGQPQTIAYHLLDERGKAICSATVTEVQVVDTHSNGKGSVVPRQIKLVWPEQQIEMTMKIEDAQAVTLERTQAAKYFSRDNLRGKKAFDLARDVMPGMPTGRVQQAGATSYIR
jgi:hypothetical protein